MDNNNLNQQINSQNEQIQAQQTQQVVQQPVVYVQQPVYTQQPQYTGQVAKPGRGKGLAFSIVSLSLSVFAIILAVVSFILALTFSLAFSGSSSDLVISFVMIFYYSLFVIGFSVPALILGSKAKKIMHFGMASAGVVLSIISLILAGLSILMNLFAMAL